MKLIVLMRGTWVEPRKAAPFRPWWTEGFFVARFSCAPGCESSVRMWRVLANPQKDVSIRRLTTGGVTV
jgi:hypothetical protein